VRPFSGEGGGGLCQCEPDPAARACARPGRARWVARAGRARASPGAAGAPEPAASARASRGRWTLKDPHGTLTLAPAPPAAQVGALVALALLLRAAPGALLRLSGDLLAAGGASTRRPGALPRRAQLLCATQMAVATGGSLLERQPELVTDASQP